MNIFASAKHAVSKGYENSSSPPENLEETVKPFSTGQYNSSERNTFAENPQSSWQAPHLNHTTSNHDSGNRDRNPFHLRLTPVEIHHANETAKSSEHISHADYIHPNPRIYHEDPYAKSYSSYPVASPRSEDPEISRDILANGQITKINFNESDRKNYGITKIAFSSADKSMKMQMQSPTYTNQKSLMDTLEDNSRLYLPGESLNGGNRAANMESFVTNEMRKNELGESEGIRRDGTNWHLDVSGLKSELKASNTLFDTRELAEERLAQSMEASLQGSKGSSKAGNTAGVDRSPVIERYAGLMQTNNVTKNYAEDRLVDKFMESGGIRGTQDISGRNQADERVYETSRRGRLEDEKETSYDKRATFGRRWETEELNGLRESLYNSMNMYNDGDAKSFRSSGMGQRSLLDINQMARSYNENQEDGRREEVLTQSIERGEQNTMSAAPEAVKVEQEKRYDESDKTSPLEIQQLIKSLKENALLRSLSNSQHETSINQNLGIKKNNTEVSSSHHSTANKADLISTKKSIDYRPQTGNSPFDIKELIKSVKQDIGLEEKPSNKSEKAISTEIMSSSKGSAVTSSQLIQNKSETAQHTDTRYYSNNKPPIAPSEDNARRHSPIQNIDLWAKKRPNHLANDQTNDQSDHNGERDSNLVTRHSMDFFDKKPPTKPQNGNLYNSLNIKADADIPPSLAPRLSEGIKHSESIRGSFHDDMTFDPPSGVIDTQEKNDIYQTNELTNSAYNSNQQHQSISQKQDELTNVVVSSYKTERPRGDLQDIKKNIEQELTTIRLDNNRDPVEFGSSGSQYLDTREALQGSPNEQEDQLYDQYRDYNMLANLKDNMEDDIELSGIPQSLIDGLKTKHRACRNFMEDIHSHTIAPAIVQADQRHQQNLQENPDLDEYVYLDDEEEPLQRSAPEADIKPSSPDNNYNLQQARSSPAVQNIVPTAKYTSYEEPQEHLLQQFMRAEPQINNDLGSPPEEYHIRGIVDNPNVYPQRFENYADYYMENYGEPGYGGLGRDYDMEYYNRENMLRYAQNMPEITEIEEAHEMSTFQNDAQASTLRESKNDTRHLETQSDSDRKHRILEKDKSPERPQILPRGLQPEISLNKKYARKTGDTPREEQREDVLEKSTNLKSSNEAKSMESYRREENRQNVQTLERRLQREVERVEPVMPVNDQVYRRKNIVEAEEADMHSDSIISETSQEEYRHQGQARRRELEMEDLDVGSSSPYKINLDDIREIKKDNTSIEAPLSSGKISENTFDNRGDIPAKQAKDPQVKNLSKGLDSRVMRVHEEVPVTQYPNREGEEKIKIFDKQVEGTGKVRDSSHHSVEKVSREIDHKLGRGEVEGEFEKQSRAKEAREAREAREAQMQREEELRKKEEINTQKLGIESLKKRIEEVRAKKLLAAENLKNTEEKGFLPEKESSSGQNVFQKTIKIEKNLKDKLKNLQEIPTRETNLKVEQQQGYTEKLVKQENDLKTMKKGIEQLDIRKEVNPKEEENEHMHEDIAQKTIKKPIAFKSMFEELSSKIKVDENFQTCLVNNTKEPEMNETIPQIDLLKINKTDSKVLVIPTSEDPGEEPVPYQNILEVLKRRAPQAPVSLKFLDDEMKAQEKIEVAQKAARESVSLKEIEGFKQNQVRFDESFEEKSLIGQQKKSFLLLKKSSAPREDTLPRAPEVSLTEEIPAPVKVHATEKVIPEQKVPKTKEETFKKIEEMLAKSAKVPKPQDHDTKPVNKKFNTSQPINTKLEKEEPLKLLSHKERIQLKEKQEIIIPNKFRKNLKQVETESTNNQWYLEVCETLNKIRSSTIGDDPVESNTKRDNKAPSSITSIQSKKGAAEPVSHGSLETQATLTNLDQKADQPKVSFLTKSYLSREEIRKSEPIHVLEDIEIVRSQIKAQRSNEIKPAMKNSFFENKSRGERPGSVKTNTKEVTFVNKRDQSSDLKETIGTEKSFLAGKENRVELITRKVQQNNKENVGKLPLKSLADMLKGLEGVKEVERSSYKIGVQGEGRHSHQIDILGERYLIHL